MRQERHYQRQRREALEPSSSQRQSIDPVVPSLQPRAGSLPSARQVGVSWSLAQIALQRPEGVALQKKEQDEGVSSLERTGSVAPARSPERNGWSFAHIAVTRNDVEAGRDSLMGESRRQGEVVQGRFGQPTETRAGAQQSTDLPEGLKAGVEQLSGLALDDVRVHYNSSQPERVGALAYTQGTEIHVGPGQERHLAHEAWHVVQQKQGRVQPTRQMKGVAINDEEGLEHEADVMGEKARLGDPHHGESSSAVRAAPSSSSLIQRFVDDDGNLIKEDDTRARAILWYLEQQSEDEEQKDRQAGELRAKFQQELEKLKDTSLAGWLQKNVPGVTLDQMVSAYRQRVKDAPEKKWKTKEEKKEEDKGKEEEPEEKNLSVSTDNFLKDLEPSVIVTMSDGELVGLVKSIAQNKGILVRLLGEQHAQELLLEVKDLAQTYQMNLNKLTIKTDSRADVIEALVPIITRLKAWFEVKFGPELSFTSLELLDLGLGDFNLNKQDRQKEPKKAKEAQGRVAVAQGKIEAWAKKVTNAKVEKAVRSGVKAPDAAKMFSYPELVVQTEQGGTRPWRWYLDVDAGCLEVQMDPIPIAMFPEVEKIIDLDIFKIASEIQLYPAPYIGDGHLNLDRQSAFQGNALAFRNFLVLYTNESPTWDIEQRGVGDIEQATLISELSQQFRLRFQNMIAQFDEVWQMGKLGNGDEAIDMLAQQLYEFYKAEYGHITERTADPHYRAINVEHLFANKETEDSEKKGHQRVEMRRFPAQNSVLELKGNLSQLTALIWRSHVSIPIPLQLDTVSPALGDDPKREDIVKKFQEEGRGKAEEFLKEKGKKAKGAKKE